MLALIPETKELKMVVGGWRHAGLNRCFEIFKWRCSMDRWLYGSEVQR